ncbi:MAG: acetate/propionate family kinase [Candidatus Paceibacteria bacterium]
MEKKYLIVNLGSVSKKYAIYFGKEIKLRARVERGGADEDDFELALEKFLNSAQEKGIIKNEKDINGVGLRVVAPGSYFREDMLIDEEYLKNLEEAEEKAPLHLRPLISEIKDLKRMFPEIPFAGISDSAFHKDLPKHSFYYNIPLEDAEDSDIYRFGYHGISIQSILRKIEKRSGKILPRVIVAHLGGGSSITAIHNGKSVDTSMGFTPLEGLPMVTRAGSIDTKAALQLAKEKGMNSEELNEYLNTKCGLLGLSGGKSSNVRELFDLKENGDEDASLALEVFAYQIKKYIGAYISVLGGLDMLVFSGTISEKSSSMREMILDGLEAIGIEMDKKKNNDTLDKDGQIESKSSKVKIEIIKTNEVEEIALKTINLLN